MTFRDHSCLRGPCRGKGNCVNGESGEGPGRPESSPLNHNEVAASWSQPVVARCERRTCAARSSSSSFEREARNPDFYVKSPDFEILATFSNILKTVWSKQNSSAGYIQPTGCQIETSVLDNVLMDEDNGFIACDHSSWEFPIGMN